MEKQNKLVVAILRRLSKEGILDRAMLIGSWGAYFYKYYFKNSVLETLLQENQIKPIFESFQKLSRKEKKVVLDNLIKRNHEELATRLKNQ